jgi:hypothetical protein
MISVVPRWIIRYYKEDTILIEFFMNTNSYSEVLTTVSKIGAGNYITKIEILKDIHAVMNDSRVTNNATQE